MRRTGLLHELAGELWLDHPLRLKCRDARNRPSVRRPAEELGQRNSGAEGMLACLAEKRYASQWSKIFGYQVRKVNTMLNC
jgi:hypothetical protein